MASPAQAESDVRPSAVAEGSRDAPGERARVILLVRTRGDEAVMTRVRAELLASSWRVLEIRLDERAGRVPLARVAAAQDVRAAVRLDSSEGRVELWIFARTGDIEETLAGEEQRGDDLVLAYRITEALRARGLALGNDVVAPTAETPSASEAPARPASPLPAPKKPARPKASSAREAPEPSGAIAPTVASDAGLWLELGPALDTGIGGLGPAAAAWAGLRLALPPRWSLGLFGSIPVLPQSLGAAEGSARVSTYVVGAVADVDWLVLPRLRAGFGLGVGGAVSWMRGEPARGYLGFNDTVSAVLPFARATARFRLAGALGVWAAVLAGATIPEISVQFADEVRGHWGRPFALAVTGLDVRCFSL